jgi:hypothetical protein
MNANLRRSEQLDQRLTDSGHQWITRGQSYDASSGDLGQQWRQPLSQRSWPRQPLLIRERGNQIKLPRTAEQHFRVSNGCAQALWKVVPPPRAQSNYLDHASDCMTRALPSCALPKLETPTPRVPKPRFTLVSDGLHTLQPVQTAGNLRERSLRQRAAGRLR